MAVVRFTIVTPVDIGARTMPEPPHPDKGGARFARSPDRVAHDFS
jgi:hypothetical protein